MSPGHGPAPRPRSSRTSTPSSPTCAPSGGCPRGRSRRTPATWSEYLEGCGQRGCGRPRARPAGARARPPGHARPPALPLAARPGTWRRSGCSIASSSPSATRRPTPPSRCETPRQARRLPGLPHPGRGGGAARRRRRTPPPPGCATGRCWRCSTPPGSGSASWSGSRSTPSSSTRATWWPGARGTRSGWSRSGAGRSEVRALARAAARRRSFGAAPRAALFVGPRGTALTRQGVWKLLRRHALAAGIRKPLSPPQAPPLLCHPPRRARGGPPRGAGDARSRRPGHHADLHPRRRPSAPRGLRRGPPA